MVLLKWLIFLLGSLTVTLIVLLLWIYFSLLTLVFVLRWLSLHWKILVMLLSQFPMTFHKTQNGMSHFIARLMTNSYWLGWSSWSFGRCSMGGYLQTHCYYCCYWSLWGGSGWKWYIYIYVIYIYNTYIYIYIYIIVSITSLISMVSAASAAAIVHRNHFFCL